MQKILMFIAALLFGLLIIYWLGSPDPEPVKQTATETSLPTEAIAPTQTTAPKAKESLTLNGLNIPLTAEGIPIASPPMRELFLSLTESFGDQPVDEWKANLFLPYQNQLSPQALQRLQQVFNYYVEYDLALQLFAMEGEPSLKAALPELQKLRQTYLQGANAESLFEDWLQLEEFTLQTVEKFTASSNLETTHKQLQQQLQSLPESVQPRAQRLIDNMKPLMDMASVQGSGQQINEMLEQIAATSLVQPSFVFTDPDEAFMEAYLTYAEQKNQMGLSQEEDLQPLRQKHFSGADRLRAKTLDRMEQM